jgi:hypothetical protein
MRYLNVASIAMVVLAVYLFGNYASVPTAVARTPRTPGLGHCTKL